MRSQLIKSFAINTTGLKAALLRKRSRVTINDIARRIQENGGDVDESIVGNTVYMVVNHIDADTVEEIFYDIPYIVDYFITDDDDEPELFADSTSARAWPAYESVSLREDRDFSDDERLNDCNCTGPNCKKDEFDECDKFEECGSYNEDEDFDECEKFESVRPRRSSRKLVSARKLLERRKGCCPPKKVKLSEALKIDRNTIKKATQKALNEKRVISAKKSNFEKLKKQLGEKKYNFIIEALNNKRTKLYTNKNINGKNMTEYTDKQLYNLMKTVDEQIKKYETTLSSLNESLSIDEKVELSDKINNKKRLLNILDEELTYRLTVKKMLKESDENPLEPLPVGPDAGNVDNDDNTDNSDNADNADNGDNGDNADNTDDGANDPEEDETAELESIVITFDTQDAAEEFIDACVEAGIPEDAIELEDEEPEAEGEGDETETEGEGDETEGEGEGDGDEDTNESQHYDRFRRLLEADDSDETEGDDENAEGEGDETEGDDENAEGEDEGDDEKTFKVVLRDTDYIGTLAQVLSDQYGISQEELEDSIGGEIVDEENADNDDSADDNPNENSGEGSKGDDAIDAMTPEELDNLFNGE